LTNFGVWLTKTKISPEREFGTYGDKFGRWASGYMPLTNEVGENVAAIGVDFQADYVNQVRDEVSSQVRDAFLVSYPVLMILVIVVTSLFTRPLLKLSGNAERIAEGDYEVDFSDLMKGRYKDEIDTLASVFEVMVDKVREREQTLKRQVAQLKIEIDESKKKSEVSEIVDTDFFKDLQSRASKLREKRSGEEE
jgi:methyl-accepting chemotaxis protein